MSDDESQVESVVVHDEDEKGSWSHLEKGAMHLIVLVLVSGSILQGILVQQMFAVDLSDAFYTFDPATFDAMCETRPCEFKYKSCTRTSVSPNVPDGPHTPNCMFVCKPGYLYVGQYT